VIARVPSGVEVGITGIGACIPERVMTNADITKLVDTSDEWIFERTGIRERRIAGADQAPSDLAVPAAREALERAGVLAAEVDLILLATALPDMFFPATASLVGEQLGAVSAAACDLQAGCTGFVYALAQGYASVASGLVRRALVIGAETLSRAMNWNDRTTCILFGDGAAAVVLERVQEGGFLGFELGSDGSGGPDLSIPGGGARHPATRETVEQHLHYLHMNGKEVFRFATRVMVTSAERLLGECGLTVDDVDVYAPHQANRRIIDHAVRHLGIPPEKVLLNVDRFGNTSSASIPLALYEGVEAGTVAPGMTVLMTGVGAGLTWGSSLVVWGNGK
jgi:3-oxoacyl-[acyl-carrier-protein] synthase-3